MDILKNLKLDNWWSVMLWCGVALFVSGVLFDIQVIERKHIIGLGVGFFIVGMTYFRSLRYLYKKEIDGYFEGQTPILSTTAKIIVCIGWAIIIFFGIKILWCLAQ